MPPSRRTVAVLVAIALLLTAGVVAANLNLSRTVDTSGTVPLQAQDGMAVFVEGDTQQFMEENFLTSGTVEVVAEEGNMTFFSSGDANATVQVDDIEGTYTNITAIDADPDSVTLNPEDKDSAIVGQEIDEFAWRSGISEDDGTVDFSYGASGPGEVTVQGVSGNTDLYAVDADTDTILDSATSNGGGAVTFDALASGDHDVVLQTGVNKPPTISNPSPTSGQTTPPTEISIDVNDPNFPQGDSVDVIIDVDGSQVHSETVTSNQTVTASIPSSAQAGGSHSWSVEVTDDFGGQTSNSYSYSVPSELQIRTEEPPHDLVETQGATDPIVVEATFYEDVEDDPEIINRTTTDGTISLDGLPVSSEFSVQVHAPGYHNRTVRLDSIFQQSEVFIIDRGETTVENRFLVSDRTGNFPSDETSILIQAPVNESLYDSGGINWLTVSGDDLGADEAYSTDLVEEKRYRIVVENEDGDRRILGAYTAETDGAIELTIGNVDINPQEGDTVGINTTWQNTTSGEQVFIGYNDTARDTERIHLEIQEYRNESNVLVSNTTYNGPFGEFTQTEPVPAGENDTTWHVTLVGERPDQENVRIERPVGPGQPTLTDMPAYLVTVLFVGVIWMVAGLFSQLNGGIGALIVAGFGGIFFFMGIVPGYLGGGVVALSMLTAGLLVLRERGAGGL